MEWIKTSPGRHERRIGAISIEVAGDNRLWGVTLYFDDLTITIGCDYRRADSAKRAALRWVKRLQEGLK